MTILIEQPVNCVACLERGKTWKGGDPKCGFPNGQEFSNANWMCATVNKIRVLCEKKAFGISHHLDENQHYATISLIDFNVLPVDDSEGYLNNQPVCLWVGWYKERGRTEAMWLMFENDQPRSPTEEECLSIIEYYSNLN